MRLPLVSSLALATSLSLAGCATTTTSPPAAAPAASAQIPSQLPRNVRPLYYSISAAPDAANLRFTSSVQIDIEVLEPTDTIILNAAELDFASVTIDGGARARVTTDADAQTATFRFLALHPVRGARRATLLPRLGRARLPHTL